MIYLSGIIIAFIINCIIMYVGYVNYEKITVSDILQSTFFALLSYFYIAAIIIVGITSLIFKFKKYLNITVFERKK